jgi:manganese-dependent inorganic pyrophosphatase
MSTTTPRDREAVVYLASIAGKDPESFGSTLIRNGMNLDDLPVAELIVRDVKTYLLHDKKISIAQVMTASDSYHLSHDGEIRSALHQVRIMEGIDLAMVLFTDVIGQVSYLYADGEEGLVRQLGYANAPVCLPGVMSRKKDFFPVFGHKFRQVIQS